MPAVQSHPIFENPVPLSRMTTLERDMVIFNSTLETL